MVNASSPDSSSGAAKGVALRLGVWACNPNILHVIFGPCFPWNEYFTFLREVNKIWVPPFKVVGTSTWPMLVATWLSSSSLMKGHCPSPSCPLYLTLTLHLPLLRPWLVIYLFPVPFLAPQPCGRAVIIINAQKLIIYYAVYDAIGWQRELSVKKSLNTQQDITASSSAV